MFNEATSFTSNLSHWDVRNVRTMSYMFCKASKFNSDLNSWNISNVRYTPFMFSGATMFDRNNIRNWDLNLVIRTYNMIE